MSNWRRFGLAPLVLALSGCPMLGGGHDQYPTVSVRPTDDLQAILDTLRGPVVVELEPGDYHLEAVDFTDPSCGNCEDASEQVPATRGLRIHLMLGTAPVWERCDAGAIPRDERKGK